MWKKKEKREDEPDILISERHKQKPFSLGHNTGLYLQHYDKKFVFCNAEKTNSTLYTLTKGPGSEKEKGIGA